MSIHCIVLAGGLGTRLMPITQHKPKPLVLYKGVPLISRIVNSLYPFCQSLTVVTKHMHEQFLDIPYSFRKCNLTYSDTDNMAAAFLEACKSVDEDYVVGISSDIVFAEDIVEKAFSRLSSDCVHVFLTKSDTQSYKKWYWEIDNERLLDIRIEENPTGYEKLFILFPKTILEEYTKGFEENMATSKKELQGHESFNSGWIYLLHKMLIADIEVRAVVLDGVIENINSIEDLKAI